MNAFLHFSATRKDGSKDSFQTIGVPAKWRDDGALLILWGRWRAVRMFNGHGKVIIAGETVPVQVAP